MTQRYEVTGLTRFAADLFLRAGLDAEKARVTAEILLEGDLLGHTTHGLALLPQYLDAATSGLMIGRGAPEVLASTTVVETWDGMRLPAPGSPCRPPSSPPPAPASRVYQPSPSAARPILAASPPISAPSPSAAR